LNITLPAGHITIRKMIRNFYLLAALFLLSGIAGCSGKKTDAPILLLSTDANFGSYTGEILRTEGFNAFKTDSLNGDNVTTLYLRQFDLVILTESKIDARACKMLERFVKKGGNLIAFRPDTVLAPLFGIIPSGGHIAEGYLDIDTATLHGKGLVCGRLQFHGIADQYDLNGAESVANLFHDKASPTKFPGVVKNNFGKGHTIAFLYNLPKSIVYTRQGNPLHAGMEKDGIPALRAMDLFTDGWLDTSNNTINQADEQMALLSHCIEEIAAIEKPLPRFWYFPDTLKCLITLTNDGEYQSETDFEPQFRDVDSMGASMSLYVLKVKNVSKAWVDKWTASGFEISGHPDNTKEAGNPGWNSSDSALKTKKEEIAAAFGLPMRTNVNHWFLWCGRDVDGNQDFAAAAKLEEENGIGLDMNYAHYDMQSNQGAYYLGTPGTNQGNFTGSGLVMKYAGSTGKIINVYQHVNAVYDQQYNESQNPDGFYECFRGLADRSLHQEVYSFISIKSHNDEYYFSKAPLMKMLAYANSHNIPVWTADRLLDFIKMKDEASFSHIHWTNNRLTFELSSSLKSSGGLTFILPVKHGLANIGMIKVNGKEIPSKTAYIKGHAYALLTVTAGRNYRISADYR
jgi:hypothetical protein